MVIDLLRDHSLKSYNTFGIDVKARYFKEADTLDNLKEVLGNQDLKNEGLLILGGGSNILFTADYNGLVIRNGLKGIEVTQQNEEHVYVKVASGEVWHDFVMYCVERGWGGVENLSLIPGSVGASPMQNIGAYGVEIKDVFHSLEAVDLNSLETVVFQHSDCHFGYRESVFKHEFRNRYFITSVTYRLNIHPVLNTTYGAINQELAKHQVSNPGIQDVSNAVIHIRRSKLPDPAILGNAGSFFKNPEITEGEYQRLQQSFPNVVAYPLADGNYKLAAGWLIEQCGWKGKRVGNTGSHKDQALVIVNYGNAKGNEIQELAFEIRKSVHDKFGVWINPEVNII